MTEISRFEAAQPTVLKPGPGQGEDYGEATLEIQAGEILEGKIARREGNHTVIELYLYTPHFETEGPGGAQQVRSSVQDRVTFGEWTTPDGRWFAARVPDGFVQKALSEENYQALSAEFGMRLPAVKAVIEVESAGSGFILTESAPARPKILFETHHFYKHSKGPYSQTHPHLSTKRWTRNYNFDPNKADRDPASYSKLKEAYALEPAPALMSCSWGLGQVLGSNWEYIGCPSLEQFIVEEHMDEYHQARHMLMYCRAANLIGAANRRDYHTFARGYNGPAYASHGYHIKLAVADRKHSK